MTDYPNRNKFYQRLNSTPRSMKNYGKHRRTSPPAYGYTVIGTDPGSGGTDKNFPGITRISFGSTEPAEPTIPYAGIRTGELIGHRLWWVIDTNAGPLLSSLAHKFIWLPGQTIRGDINAPVEGPLGWMGVMGGVYSHKESNDLISEIRIWGTMTANADAFQLAFFGGWCPLNETKTLVRGTIKMWGEVVEHDTGYRAEFAKIVSLDEVATGEVDIETLRRKYLT